MDVDKCPAPARGKLPRSTPGTPGVGPSSPPGDELIPLGLASSSCPAVSSGQQGPEQGCKLLCRNRAVHRMQPLGKAVGRPAGAISGRWQGNWRLDAPRVLRRLLGEAFQASPAAWLPPGAAQAAARHAQQPFTHTTRAHASGSACNSRASRAARFVARRLRRSTLRENRPSPSSPLRTPRCAVRGVLRGDARRAKARFLMHTTQPTPNPRPVGGCHLPLPSPSGGNEERPKPRGCIFHPGTACRHQGEDHGS
jgi:hypothetical protein